MAQAVSPRTPRRLLTAEVQDQPQAGQSGIRHGQSGTETASLAALLKKEAEQKRNKKGRKIRKTPRNRRKKESEDRGLLECSRHRHRRFGATCCPYVHTRRVAVLPAVHSLPRPVQFTSAGTPAQVQQFT